MEKRALAFVACRAAFAKCNHVGNTRQKMSWNSEVSKSRLASTALPVATINGNIWHGCRERTSKRVGDETRKKVIFQKFWAAVYANSSEGEAVEGNSGYNEEQEKGKSVKVRDATGNAANRGAEREERETESHGADASKKKRRISFGKLPAAGGKSNESGGSEKVAGKGASEGNASTENRKLPSEDSSVTTADREGRALNIKREFILKMTSNYRYTKDSKCLTPQQRVFYEKNGYLVFPRLVPQDVLDKCNRRFDDIISGKAPRDGIIVMYDVKDRKSVNKIQDLTHDEVFDGYCRHKNILDIVEAFTGPNIMAIHSMLIAKPPDVGFGSSKHPPHQDLYYFPIRPAHKIVASWTAMEPCDRENGCLYVAPGTHRHDHLYKHDYAPGSEPGTINKFYHGILDLPESVDWVDLEMEPGDTVFFHPLLIHGSGVNMSQRTRRAISCHYAAADCDYVDVSEMGKTRITEELMEYVHKRYPGVQLTYQDIWRAKSTLARGIRSNL